MAQQNTVGMADKAVTNKGCWAAEQSSDYPPPRPVSGPNLLFTTRNGRYQSGIPRITGIGLGGKSLRYTQPPWLLQRQRMWIRLQTYCRGFRQLVVLDSARIQ